MRNYLAIVLLLVGISSCNNYDFVLRQTDDIVIKYKCKHGKDTLNSKKYRFFKDVLISEATIVNGKVQGSVIDYFPNGKIRTLSYTWNSLPHGINKVYSNQGTLLRRSLYIEGKQVLFESRMVNSDKTVNRRKLVARINNDVIWAGEFYSNIDDTVIITNYKGMYVDLLIDDTISIEKEYKVELKVYLPIVMSSPEFIIGDFDKNLICIDTIEHIKQNNTKEAFFFNYKPPKTGNLFLVGKLVLPDNYIKEDIYFFKGFYVKED